VRRRLVGRTVFRSKTAALDLQYQCINDTLLCDDDVRKGLSVALELHEPELEIDDTMFQLDECHARSLAKRSDGVGKLTHNPTVCCKVCRPGLGRQVATTCRRRSHDVRFAACTTCAIV
jgi:hypothetical protein